MPSITYYGNWDLESAEATRGVVEHLSQPTAVDIDRGVITVSGREPVLLSSLDVIDVSGSDHLEFEHNPNGFHLLVNSAVAESALLDDRTYHSTAVQLLIRPIDEINSTFEIVVDRAPHARIFRVQ